MGRQTMEAEGGQDNGGCCDGECGGRLTADVVVEIDGGGGDGGCRCTLPIARHDVF